MEDRRKKDDKADSVKLLINVITWVAIAAFQYGVFTARMNDLSSRLDHVQGNIDNVQMLLMQKNTR